MKAEKDISFGEQRRFGGVYIFPAFCRGIEYSSTERDHFPYIITDRKHETISKAIVNSGVAIFFFLQLYESAFDKFVSVKSGVLGPRNQGFPGFWRVTELPPLCHIHINSAISQIGSGVVRSASTQQILMEPSGGLKMKAKQALPQVLVCVFFRAEFGFENRNTRPRCKATNGFGK